MHHDNEAEHVHDEGQPTADDQAVPAPVCECANCEPGCTCQDCTCTECNCESCRH